MSIQTEDAPVTTMSQDGLGTASLALGILGFFPIPGVAASVVAIVLGIAAHLGKTPASAAGRQRAMAGIALGAVSLMLFITFCVIYFGILGYPLPHIARYRQY